jgi:GT2 family glycosyltransferase
MTGDGEKPQGSSAGDSRPATTAAEPAGTGTKSADDVAGITAVIVNWETPDYTIRAARALMADGLPRERLVVVDNGSKDDSHERFQRELEGCVLHRIEQNAGYGRAANAGARELRGSSYLLINSDAFLHTPGSLRALVRALRDRSVGMVMPRILNEDLTLQPTVTALQTPGVALVRASGLSRFVPNRWQPSWSTHWDHSSSREIQAAAAVVILVREEAWNRLGGFDERIYFYAEDLDICMRLRQAGWKVWFESDSEFVHVGQGSTVRRWPTPARAEMIGRSEAMMTRRLQSPAASRLSIGFIAAGLSARYAYYSAVGRPEAAAAFRAELRGYMADPDESAEPTH